MPSLQFARAFGAALAGALVVLGPAAAAARAQAPIVDLSAAAERIVDAVRQRGVSRVAIVPVEDPAGQPSGLGRAITDGLRQAITLVRLPANYAVDVVSIDDVRRTLASGTAAGPASGSQDPGRLSPALAAAAAAVRAPYVVTGDLQPSGGSSRLTLRVYDVATHRRIRTTTTDIGEVSTSGRAASPVVIATPPEPYWTPRRAAVTAGFVSAGAAATMAILTDRRLRSAKRDLLNVPAGAPDIWNAQLAEATGIEKTRDFWWGAAVGLAGLTTTYVITRSSPDIAAHPSLGATSPTGRSAGWRLQVTPFHPRVLLAYGF